LTLSNAIVANEKKVERHLEEQTGIILDWEQASTADREAIRKVRNAMVHDLNKDIARAIVLGEARMLATEEKANAHIEAEKKGLLTTIASSVENMADNVFLTIQENRGQIADNYLSLKAYAHTAADAIEDYLQKGKGRNLSSIGDLLYTLAQSATLTPPAPGMFQGVEEIPSIFTADTIHIKQGVVSKINGLVNEYITTLGSVKDRWPLGLGKYLICKLEIAMQKAGALEVDKIEGKAGNFVFVNAHSVGLSSKLSDFEQLAVRMTDYENTLSHLTGKISDAKHAGNKPKIYAKPPEWEGN